MISMYKAAMVLKSDEAGRVKTPVARQVALVREFERSGLSGPRFGELAGVNYQTLPHGVGIIAFSGNCSCYSDGSSASLHLSLLR